MDISEFDYNLPQELIAQFPSEKRDESRLLVVHRERASLESAQFHEIGNWLRAGDVLAMNNTEVFPARLKGYKEPGGAAIEMLLLEKREELVWVVIAYRASRLKRGTEVVFGDELKCRVVECLEEGKFLVQFECQEDWDAALSKLGEIPLPPYIERKNGEYKEIDRERYQTVFAEHNEQYNSAAAPTAGLHFTEELLQQLEQSGIHLCHVTLRVGLDTFLPMRVEHIEEHEMHTEAYYVPETSAKCINQAASEGRRVIAVGTTSVRVLESAVDENRKIRSGPGSSNLFIQPGYQFNMVDGMITNFHLPRTTLILLVSAFMGNELRKTAYEYAIEQNFRFYSYGDAMLIL